MKRKTKEITFNLYDRGHKYIGQSRNNVDVKEWIRTINSPATQELVNTGGMFGYYGHQIRMLFGINPPETGFIEGRQVTIVPALRTISLSADSQGNVTHRQEFLETPFGQSALERYEKNIGGFSMANDKIISNGIVIPTMPCGFDYVFQPNYASNIGDGALYDSVSSTCDDALSLELKQSFMLMYDSVMSECDLKSTIDEYRERAYLAEEKIKLNKSKKLHRENLIQAKNDLLIDSALCPTIPLEEYMKACRDGVEMALLDDIQQPEEKTKSISERVIGGIFGG